MITQEQKDYIYFLSEMLYVHHWMQSPTKELSKFFRSVAFLPQFFLLESFFFVFNFFSMLTVI